MKIIDGMTVEVLRDMLARAERGEIRDVVVIAGNTAGASCSARWTIRLDQQSRMIGDIHLLAHAIVHNVPIALGTAAPEAPKAPPTNTGVMN